MANPLQIKFPPIGNNCDIIIEAGHIYTNEVPANEHKLSANLGYLLTHYLESFYADTTNWLFVDNYNPQFEDKPLSLNLDQYVAQLTSWGFPPSKVLFEADLVEQAKDLLGFLKKNNFAGPHHSGNTVLNKGHIQLYDPSKDKYMCSLLDACLYIEKLKHADGCITVLDQQYTSQQKGTLTILKKLGIDTSNIFPFYYHTPASKEHKSVDLQNVVAGKKKGVPFVQSAIDLVQIVSKLSGSIAITTEIDLEAGLYGI